MDPGTLGLLSLGLTAASAGASFLGGKKPQAPKPPSPMTPPTPDAQEPASGKTSFLSNAAAAATPSQTGGKSLLGQ